MSTTYEARRGRLQASRPVASRSQTAPLRIAGLDKSEVERLLDWLEVNGFPPCTVSVDESGFVLELPADR
jgi:hypothetical protein